jgi:catechol 2,3-dioxygenase-like lactoylglutathione lyase family enzyme
MEPERGSLAQVALCTNNLVRSVEFLSTCFGFKDAHGEIVWGEDVARIQGVGERASCCIWWLVGRQSFLQLEIIQHAVPHQKPLRADWRPSDIGWTRWGVAVPDLDGSLALARTFGAEPLTAPLKFGDGTRRVCVRDPFVGCFIEIIEDGPHVPGGVRARHHDAEPAILYASLSVPDLAAAREFWTTSMGLQPVDEVDLHSPEMEQLWGLAGAVREVAVLRAGDRYVELVEYKDPVGRPHPPGYLVSDQGIMNIAIGFRERGAFDGLIERLAILGVSPFTPIPPAGGPAGGYIYAPDGASVELLTMDARFDASFGFIPRSTTGMDSFLKETHAE